ncbi:MAG TPA: DUF4350 domain-containing protein [Pyrinomonadaceae bacterium]|jgi:hypothetical protein
MRQRLGLIVTVVVVVGLLIVINSVTFVSQEEKPDSELSPNRSTYHAGPTGVRALYDLLSESGYRVMRWREVPERLLSQGKNVTTFVIIGDTQLAITEEEAENLLIWVNRGGRLVLVDRRPELHLLPKSGDWEISTQFQDFPSIDTDPAIAEDMIGSVKPVSPVQPTLLTSTIESVMPSRFAATVSFALRSKPVEKTEHQMSVPVGEPYEDEDYEGEEEQPPAPVVVEQRAEKPMSPAPVVHLCNAKGPLLVDYPHGLGRIVVLSDPYIFCNNGVGQKDNFQLAINMLASSGGLIAFDEYHQGRGTTENALIGYFAGTPVLPFFGQIAFLAVLVLWTRGRRFARPLPLAHLDRRSTLEFVASMAEVQQRARAYDLAIENIYTRTRRVLVRYAGLDYNSSRSEIARRVASRSTIDARQLEVVMRQCEEAINGQRISERQSIHLVKRLREIEGSLGLRMRSREVKQAHRGSL